MLTAAMKSIRVADLGKTQFDLEVEQLQAVIANPKSAPIERKLAQERLDQIAPAQTVATLSNPDLVHGDYSYGIVAAKIKRAAIRDPHYIQSGVRLKSIHHIEWLELKAEITIAHKGKVISTRTIRQTKAGTTFKDCRAQGQGTNLTREQFEATFPQPEVAAYLVDSALDAMQAELARRG